MKVLGYESIVLARGVEAFVLEEHRISLRTVLKDRIVDVTTERVRSRLGEGLSVSPIRFGVRRSRGRVVEHEGALVYVQDDDLAEFVATKFVPPAGSRLADLLGALGTRKERREFVLDLLRRKRPGTLWKGTAPGGEGALLSFTVRNRDFEEFSARGLRNQRSVFHGGYEGCLVVADRTLRYAEHEVPRRVCAWTGPQMGSDSVTWYDGQRFGLAERPEDLPPALYRELDEVGRSGNGRLAQPLPQPALEAVALLRVPSRKEVETAGPPPAETPAPFDRPLYLIDTRDAVPIPEGLPVLTDPAEALAVAARSQKDIFVPGDLPATGHTISEEPRWCLAAGLGD